LKQATLHYYTAKSATCGNSTPIDTLLDSKFINDMFTTRIDPFITKAKSYGLPVRVDEANSYPCGGIIGASNTYVSTLWGVNFMFTALTKGVSGVNFHGALFRGTDGMPSYSPINQVTNSTNINAIYPNPIYYGMLVFKYGASNGKLVQKTFTNGLTTLQGWAVVNNDGKLRVILLNKASTQQQVTINTTTTFASGDIIRTYSPALTQTISGPNYSAIKFGGNPVTPDGTWVPSATGVKAITLSGNTATVTLTPISATVVTFYPQGGTISPTQTLIGDANKDGKVDQFDLNIYLNNYNTNTTSGESVGDFNKDGVVDVRDYSIWLNNYTG